LQSLKPSDKTILKQQEQGNLLATLSLPFSCSNNLPALGCSLTGKGEAHRFSLFAKTPSPGPASRLPPGQLPAWSVLLLPHEVASADTVELFYFGFLFYLPLLHMPVDLARGLGELTPPTFPSFRPHSTPPQFSSFWWG
jgi:hypothetical protein